MIVYFADRYLNILGQASTSLPEGLTVKDDVKIEDVETGVASFECYIPFDKKNQNQVDECAQVGNYILRNHGEEHEFYTIIESEKDSKSQECYVYAEDAGLDLINEVVGAYAADKAYPIEHYINMYAKSSGFAIGLNEASNLSRKLDWDGESSATERLASVATGFDCEISYSFEIKGLTITKMLINVHRKRGQDIGAQLRLNQDIDRIVTKQSIANLATALKCVGGTPENAEKPITLKGYKYDDGDFYVDGEILKSRDALMVWGRNFWTPNKTSDGHITKIYTSEATTQKALCTNAITKLKSLRNMEVNYEVEFTKLPDNIRIGDRVNIVDDKDELYLSTRLLKIETSVANQEQTATLGEFLIKTSGISQSVSELAKQFAIDAQKAIDAANAAKDKVNDLEDKVDGIQVGGRNYFRPSQTVKLGCEDRLSLTGGAAYIGFYVQTEVGEIWSLSRSDTSNNRFDYCFTSDYPVAGTKVQGFTEARSKKKIEGIKVPVGARYLFLYLSSQEDVLPDIKLEKGNKATDFTPAPEDTDSDIESLRDEYKAELQVERERITSNVSATNALGERVSSVEQTADGLTARVSNVEGDVSSLEQTAQSLSSRVSNTEGDISELSQTAQGLSSKISNAEGDISALQQTAQNLSSKVSNAEGDISALEQTAQGLSVTLGKVEDKADDANKNALDASGKADQANQNALDAAKTATNFLGFDLNGLVVGDRTKGTLKGNVLIDSDSVDIRNSTEVLASFQVNEVDLGKNNKQTVIRLCGGVGEIKADTNDSEYDIGLSVKSDEFIDICVPKIAVDDYDTPRAKVSVNAISVPEARMETKNTPGNQSAYVEVRAPGTSGLPRIRMHLYDGSEINDMTVYPDRTSFQREVNSREGFSCGFAKDNFENNVLWGGKAVWPTNATDQICNFSAPVSEQPHGILLVFRGYGGGVLNADWHTFFVSKKEIYSHEGQGHSFFLSHTPGTNYSTKYVYIYNDRLVGHENNSKAGTGADGVMYRNNKYALQYVLGV